MPGASYWVSRVRNLLQTFSLCACLLLMVDGCKKHSSSAQAAASNGGQATDQVNTKPAATRVRRGVIKQELLFDGELRAVRSREIYATTSEEAKITYLPPEGSVVKAGDRLVELDSGTLLGKIKETEEKIIAAENEIIKTRSTQEGALREMDVELSRLWLAREQARVKADVPRDLVARRDYQEYQLAFEKSQTEYQNQLAKMEQTKKQHAAEIQVKVIEKEQLEVQLRKVRSNLEGMNIRAPAEGMVIYGDHWMERRKLQVGDVVWGGFPLVRLPDLREMEVTARVNEVDGPRISVGRRVRVVLDSFPEREIAGTVKEISQSAVKAGWMAKAKVFVVSISLDNTLTDIMKPGMSTQVSIPLDESQPLLLVPRSAVRFDRDSAEVERLEDGKMRPIAVTIVSGDARVFGVADNGVLREGDQIRSRWSALQ